MNSSTHASVKTFSSKSVVKDMNSMSSVHRAAEGFLSKNKQNNRSEKRYDPLIHFSIIISCLFGIF